MKKINIYVSALLSGILLTLSFPPLPFFFLSFIAFVPILLSFSEETPKRRYLMLYIMFFIYHTGSNWWIGSWQADSDPYLTASSIVLDFVHPFIFMMPFGVFFIIKKRLSTRAALWLFPFLWTAFEWFRNLGEFAYPWLSIGNTQINNHYWIQFVDITGVWGAGFLLILFNVIIVNIMLEIGKYDSYGKYFSQRKSKILFISAFVIIVLPLLYGFIRLKDFLHENLLAQNPVISVGIVQPAINPWRKWEISVDGMIKLQFDIADSIINSGNKPDLIIWNETAIPRYIDVKNKYDYLILSDWCSTRNVSLFTGFAELRYYTSKTKTVTARRDSTQKDAYYESYNSSLMINPYEQTIPQVYTKMRLTPMAERLPYGEYLMFMRAWFEWGVGISAWGIGTKQINLDVRKTGDTIPLGPIICIESIFPEFVSKTAKNGAEFLVVITNDAWYDHTPGPLQHYLIAAMRAIENNRYVARSANTGMSGVISPTGKSISQLPQYVKAGLYEKIPRLKIITIYTKYGDWLCYLSFFVTIIAIIASYLKKVK